MEGESSFLAIAPLVFDGDNYQMWAVRMEIYLEALDLWKAIEEDYKVPPLPANPTVAQIKLQKEKKTRKSKAKACLFAVKMKEFESVKEYSNRLLSIANKVRLLGSVLNDSRIVEKMLVTILEKFEATVTTLENTKDLSKISLTELLNVLQAQEQRRSMRQEGKTKGGGFKKSYPPCRHCEKKGHPSYKCWRKLDAFCSKCNQLGHEAVICKAKDQVKEVDAQVVDQEEEEEDQLFMVTSSSGKESSESWLID
ncbi:uncharacterized protein LOC111458022 [Cucurbita moschata]|uniref:Uncharacterized protein LOC111458022 n=1 Tax=Cucurbita moschata TaxID=3662 RepID=A0A6J1GXD0_CUCMO|nr:uncharacterized protein LOC111458022 [Cucurbita moschata]